MDSWVSPQNISLPFFTLDTPKLVMYPYYKQYYEYDMWSHISTSIINVCSLWKFWIFHKPAPFFTWNTLLTKGQNVGGCRIRTIIKKKKELSYFEIKYLFRLVVSWFRIISETTPFGGDCSFYKDFSLFFSFHLCLQLCKWIVLIENSKRQDLGFPCPCKQMGTLCLCTFILKKNYMIVELDAQGLSSYKWQ